MRIVLDARKYFDYGIGTYIQNLVPYLAARDEVVLLVAPDDLPKMTLPDGVRTKINSSKKYSVMELRTIGRDANMLSADLFHTPHYTVPFGLKMPCVTTIHDVLHIKGAEYFSLPQRLYAQMSVAHACHASDAIITDSEFTKQEILSVIPKLDVPIHVVHLGISSIFTPVSSHTDVQSFKDRYSIQKPFILYTGSLKAHKNVEVLIEAFAGLDCRSDCQLAFAGASITQNKGLWGLIQANGLCHDIVELGRIACADLASAYRAASVVVLPSFYEGFGFSVLEAMASGTPAIGARAGSIPEVMAEGGILFDPESVDDLRSSLNRVIQDDALRTDLIIKGFANIRRFSWEKCARETYQIYKDVL